MDFICDNFQHHLAINHKMATHFYIDKISPLNFQNAICRNITKQYISRSFLLLRAFVPNEVNCHPLSWNRFYCGNIIIILQNQILVSPINLFLQMFKKIMSCTESIHEICKVHNSYLGETTLNTFYKTRQNFLMSWNEIHEIGEGEQEDVMWKGKIYFCSVCG